MYKIGDKVICTGADTSQHISRGDIYTIKNILSGAYLVFEEINFTHNYSAHRFEPFDEDHFRDELFTL